MATNIAKFGLHTLGTNPLNLLPLLTFGSQSLPLHGNEFEDAESTVFVKKVSEQQNACSL